MVGLRALIGAGATDLHAQSFELWSLLGTIQPRLGAGSQDTPTSFARADDNTACGDWL